MALPLSPNMLSPTRLQGWEGESPCPCIQPRSELQGQPEGDDAVSNHHVLHLERQPAVDEPVLNHLVEPEKGACPLKRSDGAGRMIPSEMHLGSLKRLPVVRFSIAKGGCKFGSVVCTSSVSRASPPAG